MEIDDGPVAIVDAEIDDGPVARVDPDIMRYGGIANHGADYNSSNRTTILAQVKHRNGI